MKYSVILSALPLACLMACLQACSTDEDGGVAEEPAVQNHAIKFSVKERPLGGSPVQKGMRRSPETTLDNISVFSLSYVVDNSSGESKKVTKVVDGNTYTWEGDAAWPANYVNGTKADTKVAWYAHTVNGSHCEEQFAYEGRPFVYFTVEENAEETGDLLVAQTTKSFNECKDSEGNAQLHLTFNHVCAAVQFYISKTASLADYKVEVKNVVLHNVARKGYCYLNNNNYEWEPDYEDDDSPMTYFTIKAFKDNTDSYLTVTDTPQVLGVEGDYLFLIPQTLTGWDKEGTPSDCYLEIDCKIAKDGNTIHNGPAYISFSATLEQNYIHPFNIKIGTGLRNGNGEKIIQ